MNNREYYSNFMQRRTARRTGQPDRGKCRAARRWTGPDGRTGHGRTARHGRATARRASGPPRQDRG